MLRRLLSITLLLTAVLESSCTDDIETPTRRTEIAGAPEIPRDLRTQVSDGMIKIEWSLSTTAVVKQFLIYRGDTAGAVVLIDSTESNSYTDSGVRNNLRYVYRVATHGANGLVSELSAPVSATPAVFSITINNDDEYTSSLDVTLQISAAPSTQFMALYDGEDIAEAAKWISYSAQTGWELPPGDGVKVVHARFRDYEGNETITSYWDTIILDTRAAISSVTESSGGQLLSAGDNLHLTLDAGETDGSARVEISELGEITLYDDGAGGDAVAADGLYEVDYQIPVSVDMVDELVVGFFEDAAGNEADPKSAPTFLNIANPPPAAALSAYVVSQTEIELIWTESLVSDFAAYLLFRDTAATVDTSSTLLVNSSNAAGNEFSDQNLEPGTEYRYLVYTRDQSGLATASNIVNVKTPENEAPHPVSLFISDQDTTSISLGWTTNSDEDFESYRIYRSVDSPVVASDANLKGVITSRNSSSFTDSDLEVGDGYYYVVLVFDRYGASAASNEVQGPNP
jgi:fibronectin type 3 domain-containing protein